MKSILFLTLSFNLLLSQTFVYECQSYKTFTKETSASQTATASFVLQLKDDKAWLFSNEISTSLERVVSVSGEKYEKDGTVFWSHGYEAMLDTPNTSYRLCSNNRYKAVWEDAKLRGNDFRAIGNEPGWYLEIGEGGKKSFLVTDYGKQKYELRLPRPFGSKLSRTTRYKIQGFLDITIEGKTCIDSMTGHRYSSKVTVKIDGKKYRGCGKALH